MYQMNPIQPTEAYPMGDSDVKTMSHKYMNYHVIAHSSDGSQFDGIIEGMDGEGVTMLVPEEVDDVERENDPSSRQPFGFGNRFRRFRRHRFPFTFFAFPFFRPFPYYYPYYPYPYPYPWYGYGGF